MGWGNCGIDSRGRLIGYYHEGTCDHPGCDAEIDRGIAYACGGMHGEDEVSCEGYFCGKHRRVVKSIVDGHFYPVCQECFDVGEKNNAWKDEETNASAENKEG